MTDVEGTQGEGGGRKTRGAAPSPVAATPGPWGFLTERGLGGPRGWGCGSRTKTKGHRARHQIQTTLPILPKPSSWPPQPPSTDVITWRRCPRGPCLAHQPPSTAKTPRPWHSRPRPHCYSPRGCPRAAKQPEASPPGSRPPSRRGPLRRRAGPSLSEGSESPSDSGGKGLSPPQSARPLRLRRLAGAIPRGRGFHSCQGTPRSSPCFSLSFPL